MADDPFAEFADTPASIAEVKPSTDQSDPFAEFADSPSPTAISKKKEPASTGVFPEQNLTANEKWGGLAARGLGVGPLLGALFPNTNRGSDLLAGAAAEGALNTATLGASDAAANMAGVPLNAPSSPRMLAPYMNATGETIGGLIPTGDVKAAQTTGQVIKQGAKAGAIYGGVSGFSSEGLKEDRTLGGAVKSGLEGAAIGAATGAVLTGLGVQAVKTYEKLTTPEAVAIGRNVRAALKPSKADLGNRIENAASQEMGNIFHINPNADKEAGSALEGFQQNANVFQSTLMNHIQEKLNSSGEVIDGGNKMAAALEKKAAQMKAAGDPAADVALLLSRAEDMKNNVTSLPLVQSAVATANRSTKGIIKTDAENIANRVIAESGGTILNDALEKLGEGGASLRKQWSNVQTINKQAEAQLNKLINSAPAEAQSMLSALTGLHGIAAIASLAHAPLTAIPIAAAGAMKAWQKTAQRELKDSNALITKTFESMRRADLKSKLPIEGTKLYVPVKGQEVEATFQGMNGNKVSLKSKDGKSNYIVDASDVRLSPAPIKQPPNALAAHQAAQAAMAPPAARTIQAPRPIPNLDPKMAPSPDQMMQGPSGSGRQNSYLSMPD